MLQKSCVLLLFVELVWFSTGHYVPSTRSLKPNDESLRHNSHPLPHRPGNPENALLLVKKEFYVRRKPANFWKAIQNCIDEGKRLASVESQRDNDALVALIGPSDDKFWLAGTDQGREGRWVSILKSEELRYTNWADGQPDNWRTENCLELDANADGKWNDLSCDRDNYYICEDTDTLLNVVGK